MPSALDAYYIGNSMTWSLDPGGLAPWAAIRGNPYQYRAPHANGTNLITQWRNPNTATFTVHPYGPLGNALPNHHWDVVTLQPFDIWDPPASDAIMIRQFSDYIASNAVNQGTQVYVYEGWPFLYRFGDLNYTDFWDQTWNGDGWAYTIHTRDYYHRLMEQVNTTGTNLEKDVLMVPMGEVMYELDRRMRAGDVPGYRRRLFLDACRRHPPGSVHGHLPGKHNFLRNDAPRESDGIAGAVVDSARGVAGTRGDNSACHVGRGGRASVFGRRGGGGRRLQRRLDRGRRRFQSLEVDLRIESGFARMQTSILSSTVPTTRSGGTLSTRK